MAQVEIYKLHKNVPPEIRKHGIFGSADSPNPKNYVREFAGELSHGMLSDVLGRTFIDPPDGYRGGPLEQGDIVIVDDQTFFFDRQAGYKFETATFDTTDIKPAVHVDYGRYVSIDEAAPIPRTFAIVC